MGCLFLKGGLAPLRSVKERRREENRGFAVLSPPPFFPIRSSPKGSRPSQPICTPCKSACNTSFGAERHRTPHTGRNRKEKGAAALPFFAPPDKVVPRTKTLFYARLNVSFCWALPPQKNIKRKRQQGREKRQAWPAIEKEGRRTSTLFWVGILFFLC